VVSVALPPVTVPLPSRTAPSKNRTVPVAIDGDTAALNVTAWPGLAGLRLDVRMVVVLALSIGALTGVKPDQAGVASGLINTSQQVGGAIGVAVATTVATTFTSHYVDAHPGAAVFSGPALTHGFAITFYVLAAIAVAGAIVAGLMTEGRPPVEQPVVVDEALLEAA